ncbi:uncharacterized protein LOC129598652 [Paramacrobiotus metropolitanus]|uniref:uncharacterized protein LOC129598652 n=1 Tax=Paramacrobiotus metropolitanus TaxID=2943436 RepID=UPI002445F38F|nr:uncharacterized protein LOC129598652 [Paramacrobiotus metropolitanus]
MEHANVWTGSQRKTSTSRKTSSTDSSAAHQAADSGADNVFLRKFSFANYARPDIPEDHGTGIQLPSTFSPDFHDRSAVLKLRFNYVGNTGMHFSALGLGTSTFGNLSDSDELKAIDTVHTALKCGINYIATSPSYGNGAAEILLGKALSSVPRKTFYIGTTVGRYQEDISKRYDFSAETVLRSVDESLARLRLPHVDIIQIQDAEFAPNLEVLLSETLPALEKVVNAGKAKFIGISGYPVNFLQDVISRSSVPLDTVLSYGRYGLFNRDLKDIIPYLKEGGVGIINSAPLGMGLLSANGPASSHPAPESLKRSAREAVAFAKERGEDLAKIAMRYCYRVPDVCTTVVNMDRPETVRETYETCIQPMTENENSVMHEVVKRFFLPLGRTHWENIEVTKYWEAMENAGLVQPRPLSESEHEFHIPETN